MREENENLMEALVRAKIEAAESQGAQLQWLHARHGGHIPDVQIMLRPMHAADRRSGQLTSSLHATAAVAVAAVALICRWLCLTCGQLH